LIPEFRAHVPLFMLLSRFSIPLEYENPFKYFIYFSLVGIDQGIDFIEIGKKSTWVFVFQNYGKF
jgi:hypothetical protein